jgi:hypothetical protein
VGWGFGPARVQHTWYWSVTEMTCGGNRKNVVHLIWCLRLWKVRNEISMEGGVFGLPNRKPSHMGWLSVQIVQIQTQTIGAVCGIGLVQVEYNIQDDVRLHCGNQAGFKTEN